ncbi:MAG: dipeptidase [Haliangium ochraceum]
MGAAVTFSVPAWAWLLPPPALVARSSVVPTPIPADVIALHQRAIVVDTHADTTQKILYDGANFMEGIPDAHLDFSRMQAGGVDAQFFSIFIYPKRTPASAFFSESLRQIRAIQAMVSQSEGRLALARSAAEVRANATRGVPSVLLGVEGGHSLSPGGPTEQLDNLRRLAAEGVRYLTLTWTNSNDIGGSCGDDGDGRGLTDFGRRVIDEMQKLGVLVDLSHVSDPLFWDAIRYARKPVILSHSSSRALANVPRNVSDAMLRAVAHNGGAVCVNFHPGFLDLDFNRALAPIWRRFKDLPVDTMSRRVREEAQRLSPVPLSRLTDHIMHMIEVAGVDHVCLGSDFDGIPTTPQGLEDAGRLPAVTAELRARGLSPGDVEKVLGANTLRVLAAAAGN